VKLTLSITSGYPADRLGFRLEDVDERTADELALRLGVGDARKPGHERFLGVDVDERDVVMVAEQRDDLVRFATAHQAVVDEHARQLLADRLVDQHRRDRRIDPARQTANDLTAADLRADLGDLGRAEFGHRPVSAQPADMPCEGRDQLGTVRRMDDLGMELHRVIMPRIVRDHREGRAGARCDRAEAGGELGHLVSVTHPHLMRLARLPCAIE
jgi:hypothetical protein